MDQEDDPKRGNTGLWLAAWAAAAMGQRVLRRPWSDWSGYCSLSLLGVSGHGW
jgi:hypothetical protein